MMGTAPIVSIPALFFDGERENHIGNISIFPSLEFKNFQSVLSNRIGLYPHQISVFLISGKNLKSRSPIDNTKKIPITDRVNFAAILRETDCFFLVELNKLERSQKPRQNLEEGHAYSSLPIELLRRASGMNLQPFDSQSPLHNQLKSPYSHHTGQLPLEHQDFENQIRNLQVKREMYLKSMNSYPYTRTVDGHVFGRVNDRVRNRSVCEECLGVRGWPIPFHHCVNDPITAGFRSTAGPIDKKSKYSS